MWTLCFTRAKDEMSKLHLCRRWLFPSVVESFGVWAPTSLEILRIIASRATTYSGLPAHRGLSNIVQQLSIVLWAFNARMIRGQMAFQEDVPGWDLPGQYSWLRLSAELAPAIFLSCLAFSPLLFSLGLRLCSLVCMYVFIFCVSCCCSLQFLFACI